MTKLQSDLAACEEMERTILLDGACRNLRRNGDSRLMFTRRHLTEIRAAIECLKKQIVAKQKVPK